MHSPAMMPQLKLVFSAPKISSGKSMAVLANANMGMMRKFTGVCNLCSIAVNFSIGIKNAKNTPASVA